MIVGLLLAAGGAARFGSQKLLASWGGVPIVRRAADALIQCVQPTIVVVGSEAAAIATALEGTYAVMFQNRDWSEGLSTSLRSGIQVMPRAAEAAVVCLGDQPGLDPDVIRAVIAHWRTTKLPIVCARYRGERGHPVLLARSVFREVESITGDVGARALMARDPSRVAFVDVDAVAPRDVDTPDDLAALDA